jgi:mRNA-degrading endonuclease HigB of HigAB toxin-antitoxin module
MKPNFNMMTKSDLRAYVLIHRDDQDAFHALADRVYANQNPEWHQPEDVDKITDLLNAPKISDASENL